MISIDPKSIEAAKLQGYLQSSVGPRPLALQVLDENGNQIYHLSVILMFLVQTHYSRFSQRVFATIIKHFINTVTGEWLLMS
jgi:hypothetical protein